VLLVRRRVKPADIASVLAKSFHEVYLCAQRHGIALEGPPLTRYLEWGPGLLTIEAGVRVAVSAELTGETDVVADTLPGGWAATTVHSGAYDRLTEAHAALQVWIEEQGLSAAGAPWELYVTDPADYPDVNDWKTDIYWPVTS
jgi:AraC family transcriptional regulator